MDEYIGKELELFQYATNWKAYFSSTIRQYIKGDVLEVGAGLGANTRFLVTSAATSWTFIEPDIELAGKIDGNTSELTILKRTVTGTIKAIESEKFDTVIYIDVLEHIDESKAEIRKINNLLVKGGHLIILVPAFQFLFNDFDSQIGHFRRYNKTLLRHEVDLKLTEKKLFYLDSFGFFASLTSKFFIKQAMITSFQVKFWDNYLIRLSKIADRIFCRQFGKSLVGIFEK